MTFWLIKRDNYYGGEIMAYKETVRYSDFKDTLHQFIYPILKVGSNYDVGDLRKKYVESSKGFNVALIREYFHNNPEEVNELFRLQDIPNKLRIGKILNGFTNEDIKASFKNFDLSYSGKTIDRLLQYKSRKVNSSKQITDLIVGCIILDLSFEQTVETAITRGPVTSFLEYSLVSKKVENRDELIEQLDESIKIARQLLQQYKNSKIIVDAFYLKDTGHPIKLHYHREDIVEIQFFALNPNKLVLDFFKHFKKFMPQYYYFAPTVLRGNFKKVCFICTSRPTTEGVRSYIDTLKSLVILNNVNPL